MDRHFEDIVTRAPNPNKRVSITARLLADKNLSSTAKLVMAALLDHRNKRTGQCNPKRKTLAQELGMDHGKYGGKRAMSRALAELRNAGFIRSKQEQRSNFYEIQEGQICPSSTVQEGQKCPTVEGQKCPSPTLLTEPTKVNLAAASSEVVGGIAAAAVENPEQNPTPKPPARATVDDRSFRVVREALYGLAPLVRLPLPDDDLVRRVIEAARGAPAEDIEATLVALYKAGQLRNMRSWGFIPLKIGDCARKAATA